MRARRHLVVTRRAANAGDEPDAHLSMSLICQVGGLSPALGGFIKFTALYSMIIVETKRLILRCFHVFDGEALDRVFGDVEVMRFGIGVQTPQWVRDWLRGCL